MLRSPIAENDAHLRQQEVGAFYQARAASLASSASTTSAPVAISTSPINHAVGSTGPINHSASSTNVLNPAAIEALNTYFPIVPGYASR